MPALFWLIAISWSVVSAYHLSRFVLRRRFVSLVVAVYPLGWVAFAAREMKLLRVASTIPFAALALLGLFVVGALMAHEMGRPRPFR